MNPLSKTKLKHFAALHTKKQRVEEGLFIAEGIKLLEEALLAEWEIEAVVVCKGKEENLSTFSLAPSIVYEATVIDFDKLSTAVSPEGVLSILRIPPHRGVLAQPLDHPFGDFGKILILEHINDPGNLGTLLRTAHWFGFDGCIVSPETAEIYNPKVVRASMGAIFHLPVYYASNFYEWISLYAKVLVIADLSGTSLYQTPIDRYMGIILGNEANGISAKLREIPSLAAVQIPSGGGGESLNVSSAGAIFMYEMSKGLV